MKDNRASVSEVVIGFTVVALVLVGIIIGLVVITGCTRQPENPVTRSTAESPFEKITAQIAIQREFASRCQLMTSSTNKRGAHLDYNGDPRFHIFENRPYCRNHDHGWLDLRAVEEEQRKLERSKNEYGETVEEVAKADNEISSQLKPE